MVDEVIMNRPISSETRMLPAHKDILETGTVVKKTAHQDLDIMLIFELLKELPDPKAEPARRIVLQA